MVDVATPPTEGRPNDTRGFTTTIDPVESGQQIRHRHLSAFRRIDQTLPLLDKQKVSVGLKSLVDQRTLHPALAPNVLERSSHLRQTNAVLPPDSREDMGLDKVHEGEEMPRRVVYREHWRRLSKSDRPTSKRRHGDTQVFRGIVKAVCGQKPGIFPERSRIPRRATC